MLNRLNSGLTFPLFLMVLMMRMMYSHWTVKST